MNRYRPEKFDEELLDLLAREMYDHRLGNKTPMTDEEWAERKRIYPGAVRMMREDALVFNYDDLLLPDQTVSG